MKYTYPKYIIKNLIRLYLSISNQVNNPLVN